MIKLALFTLLVVAAFAAASADPEARPLGPIYLILQTYYHTRAPRTNAPAEPTEPIINGSIGLELL